MTVQRQSAHGHATILLDVVFGVVIADPIEDMPGLVAAAFTLTPSALANLVLILAAIIFCSFYWLETKGFLEDSAHLFDRRNPSEYFDDRGVAGQMRFDLIGGLYLVIVASAVIQFSSLENLPLLLLFSAVFWLGDLLGTLDLRQRYARYREVALSGGGIKARWWAGHAGSAFFVWYGLINASLYLILYVIVKKWPGSEVVHSLVAAAVLLLCAFRHFAWRSAIYCIVRDRWLKTSVQ